MIHILVVEDERMVARNLCRLLTEVLGNSISVLHHVETLPEAEIYIQDHTIDVLFLDLNLSGEDGFELLSRAVAGSFQTIIASANTDQALRSYEYGVVDFIAKPFEKFRLSQALDKIIKTETASECGRGTAIRLSVRHLGKIRLVPVDSISHIRAAGRYSELLVNGSKLYIHEKKLKQLLVILPDNFQQIHKSHIVNLGSVETISSYPGSRYEVLLNTGVSLAIGRRYLSALRARLD